MATHQTAKTSYVPYRDGKIAYRRFGASSGVPLLFLIHFRGTMDKWDPLLINNIAASRPVILVDYVGVGQSTGIVANNFREWADDMLEFLSLIDVKEVDLFGFSLGGFVAEMMTLNADPNKLKIRKLILAAEEWWTRIHERNESTSGEVPTEWLSQGFKDGGAGMKAQVDALEKWSNPETSRGLEGSYDRLEQIDIPVLIANGSNDFMIPTLNSFNIQQKLPNATLLVYPNSGHASHYQYAEKFSKQAVLFLDE
ncbi:alpha/beta-hydrolase [Trichoderma asperelloides]|nr:alpha/beta-hydrolase [Trichoderma asperelloides]